MTRAALLIYAPNVWFGGGRTLLSSLLRAARELTPCTLIADARLELPDALAAGVSVHRVHPTLLGRFGGERLLKSLATQDRTVLCFGNLPPLYRLGSRVLLFLQNRYLCEDIPLKDFSAKLRMRLAAERVILRAFAHHADAIVVQTPSMQASVRSALGIDAIVAPFYEGGSMPAPNPAGGASARTTPGKFLYVASAEPHKNHRQLLAAWRLLAADGIQPELHLTLTEAEFRELRSGPGATAPAGEIHLFNHSGIGPDALRKLYREADALIYPSTVESLGLPLIEARLAGLPVIASELDYVRDAASPVQTFDPRSAESIARAVRRFLGAEEKPLPLIEPAEFLRRALSGEF